MSKYDGVDNGIESTVQTLSNPFDPEVSMVHGAPRGELTSCENPVATTDDVIDRAVDEAVVRAIFGGNEVSRRNFMKLVGSATALSVISSVFPLETAKAIAKESTGPIEKKDLKIGFLPITCATPLLLAQPMGFYAKYGIADATLIKKPAWSTVRRDVPSRRVDCSHMLAPMPLGISLGLIEPFLAKQPDVLSGPTHVVIPAVQNTNGQAITLRNDHKNVREAKDMKGFTLAVPWEQSMHNYLLRYYLAEGGVDPDKDVTIQVVPPPQMVYHIRSKRVDGYLSPDPFNQMAVFMGTGFIFKLSKELWPGHPCCVFAATKTFATEMPNTFKAVFKAIVDATLFAHKQENREQIAQYISAKPYLDKPVEVVEQVLTGRFTDGLGNYRHEPDRIDFSPFPWNSMAIWILTQMKRWGYLKDDVDYKKVAEEVFLASECGAMMKSMGADVPSAVGPSAGAQTPPGGFAVMGKPFDPEKPEEYLRSFSIRTASAAGGR